MTTGDRDEYALQLHARLVALDPVAPSEFAAAFLPELVRRLRARAGPGHDESLLQDAATDAVLDYLQHPSKFDPRKSGLFTYLTMAAYRDLLNSLAKERRRYQHEVSLEDVEEALPDGNNVLEASSPAVDEASPVSMDEIMHSLVTEFPDARDRALLELIVSGERRTAVFSNVLGIQTLATEEQRAIVKRHKDRIMKRLQRLGGRIRGER